MEGLDGDEEEAIKMICMEEMYLMIYGAYLEGTIMIGQNLPFLGTHTCGKLPKPS
jgi:hypothetical protein